MQQMAVGLKDRPMKHNLMDECWRFESVPQEVKYVKITTPYKNKSQRGCCNNYSRSSLLNITGKVFARVLLKWLQQLVDQVHPESQCAFWVQRSMPDMNFTVHLLQEKASEPRVLRYLAFVDLAKACNTVDRESLYTVLAKSGCPPTLLALHWFVLLMTACMGECSLTAKFLNFSLTERSKTELWPGTHSVWKILPIRI